MFMYSTPRNVQEAYEKGLRTKYKDKLSTEEILERKTAIDQNIVKLLEAQARLKTEMVQQYGTVRTAKEQTTNQVKVAAINYYAETGAAKTEAEGEILARATTEKMEAALPFIFGDRNVEATIEPITIKLNRKRTSTADDIRKGITGNEFIELYINKESATGNYGGEFEQDIAEGIGSLNVNERFIYKQAVRTQVNNKIQEELQEAVDSGRIDQSHVKRAQDELLAEVLTIQEGEKRAYDQAVTTARNLTSEELRIVQNANPYIHKLLTAERPSENFTLQDFVGDLEAVPGDSEIEKTIKELKAEKVALDKPPLTTYGRFEEQYLKHPKQKYLTELLGFNDPKEAALLYAQNANALKTALNTYTEPMGDVEGPDFGENVLTGMDFSRLEVAKQLGIVGEGRDRRISPLRFRIAMLRSPGVAKQAAPTRATEEAPAAPSRTPTTPDERTTEAVAPIRTEAVTTAELEPVIAEEVAKISGVPTPRTTTTTTPTTTTPTTTTPRTTTTTTPTTTTMEQDRVTAFLEDREEEEIRDKEEIIKLLESQFGMGGKYAGQNLADMSRQRQALVGKESGLTVAEQIEYLVDGKLGNENFEKLKNLSNTQFRQSIGIVPSSQPLGIQPTKPATEDTPKPFVPKSTSTLPSQEDLARRLGLTTTMSTSEILEKATDEIEENPFKYPSPFTY